MRLLELWRVGSADPHRHLAMEVPSLGAVHRPVQKRRKGEHWMRFCSERSSDLVLNRRTICFHGCLGQHLQWARFAKASFVNRVVRRCRPVAMRMAWRYLRARWLCQRDYS
mmetsp:Transcript_18645/g.51136  ORF Transcript_18645/g.51136 Transcript_18645/m.51136 type:complete len:111 (+) Transcript_18645:1329-1661(+)